MFEALVLACVGAAGYMDVSGWWALAGAAVITMTGFWRKIRLLRLQPAVPFSSKIRTYLAVSVAINLAFAWAAFLAGRLMGWIVTGY
jgi:hypothetical protein